MDIGITVEPYKGISAHDLLKLVSKIGMNYIEINVTILPTLKECIHLLQDFRVGFHLPIVGLNDYDLANPEHQEQIDELIDVLNKNHDKMNIKYYIVHPPEPDPTINWDNLLENLNKIKGPIVIENIQVMSNELFVEFVNKAEKVLGDKYEGILYDGPHAYLRGGDWEYLLREKMDKISYIHLSDCRTYETPNDTHYPFGYGDLPLETIIGYLKKSNYSGPIILELLAAPDGRVLDPIVESYLLITRKFDKLRYLSAKLRYLLFAPFIRRKLKAHGLTP